MKFSLVANISKPFNNRIFKTKKSTPKIQCVKVSKYRVFFLSVFRLNTGKYGPEKIPCLDTSRSN